MPCSLFALPSCSVAGCDRALSCCRSPPPPESSPSPYLSHSMLYEGGMMPFSVPATFLPLLQVVPVSLFQAVAHHVGESFPKFCAFGMRVRVPFGITILYFHVHLHLSPSKLASPCPTRVEWMCRSRPFPFLEHRLPLQWRGRTLSCERPLL